MKDPVSIAIACILILCATAKLGTVMIWLGALFMTGFIAALLWALFKNEDEDSTNADYRNNGESPSR